MTKRKTEAFSGGWLDGRIPVQQVRGILEGHVPTASMRPIFDVLSRQAELWSFHLKQISVDPEPSQWASILRAIAVPARPTPMELERIQVAVSKLPAQVRGVFIAEIFKRTGAGPGPLFATMMDGDPLAEQSLRSVLADMVAGLANVKARRGPRMRKGPPFRAVHAALVKAGIPDMRARELAGNLLRAVGVEIPKSRSAVAALMKPIP